MTTITPYSALCDLFRNRVSTNDFENETTRTKQYENEFSLHDFRKEVPTIDTSCQTQSLKDYNIAEVMSQYQKEISTEDRAVNISLNDDNFQILRPDYAAYSEQKSNAQRHTTRCKFLFNTAKSEEKPHREKLPATCKFLFNDKSQKDQPLLAPLLNRIKRSLSPTRECPYQEDNLKRRSSPTNERPLLVDNQTTMIGSYKPFQERIILPSNQYRSKWENEIMQEEVDDFPKLNLYNLKRRISPTSERPQQFDNQTTLIGSNKPFQERIILPSNQYRSKWENEIKQEQVDDIPKLNLYRRGPSIENIHTRNRYQAFRNPSRDINSNLKKYKINALYKTYSDLKTTFENKYNHCQNNSEEKCFCEHCGALAVVNESLKRPIIYDNTEAEGEVNDHQYCRRHLRRNYKNKQDYKYYVKLMIKLKMMEERIHELEELNYVKGPFKADDTSATYGMFNQCSNKNTRSAEPMSKPSSPKNPKICPFSINFPSNLKEKIFGRKSSKERDPTSQDTDSDDSDYKVKHMSRNKKRDPMPKPKLRCHDYICTSKDASTSVKQLGFSKASNKMFNINIQPTKDKEEITDELIEKLLIELNKKKNISSTNIPKTHNQDCIDSSNSLNNLNLKRLNKNNNSENTTQSDIRKYSSKDDCDYFFLKSPEMIEKFVKLTQEPSICKTENKTQRQPHTISKKPPNFYPLKNFDEKYEDMANSLFQSSNEPSDLSSRSSMIKREDEMFKMLHAIKPNDTEFFKQLEAKLNKTPPPSCTFITDPAKKGIQVSMKSITLSTASDMTASKSWCQYINKNFSNKTSTTNDTNCTSCVTAGTNKQSRSSSAPPVVKKYINLHLNPRKDTSNDTNNTSCATSEINKRSRSLSPDANKQSKRKKTPTTGLDYNTKIPEPENSNKTFDNQDKKVPNTKIDNSKPKNFIELNKNVNQYARILVKSKIGILSPHHSPQRRTQVENIKTAPILYCVTTGKDSSIIPTQINKTNNNNKKLKTEANNDFPRKKWSFSQLDKQINEKTGNKSVITEDNKEKIIQELRSVSHSKNRFEQKTDLNKINKDKTDLKAKDITANILKTTTKETTKKKSIVNLIKKISKQMLSTNQTKLKQIVNRTEPPIPKTTMKLVEKSCNSKTDGPKETTKFNYGSNRNISRIPVYFSPDRNTKNSRKSSPAQECNNLNEKGNKEKNVSKFTGGKKNEKFCLSKPEMKVISKNVSSDIMSSYTTTYTDQIDKSVRNDELSVNTLLLNSIDSLTKTVSNIIIINSGINPGNLPTICEQSSKKTQRNNFNIQTNVLQNLRPSINKNCASVGINNNLKNFLVYPVQNSTTNPLCSSKDTVLMAKKSLNTKVFPSYITISSNQTEKKSNVITEGNCSSTIQPKCNEDKKKKGNLPSTEQKKGVCSQEAENEKSGDEKCTPRKCSKDNFTKPSNADVKKEIIVETPSADDTYKSAISKKSSPLNFPKYRGVLSRLRKYKNKIQKPSKRIKHTTTDDKKNLSLSKANSIAEKKSDSDLGNEQDIGYMFSPENCFLADGKGNTKKKKPTKCCTCTSCACEKCKCPTFNKDTLLGPPNVEKKKERTPKFINRCSLKSLFYKDDNTKKTQTNTSKTTESNKSKLNRSSKTSLKDAKLSNEKASKKVKKGQKGKENESMCNCPSLAELIVLDPKDASTSKMNKATKSNKSKSKLNRSSKTSLKDAKLSKENASKKAKNVQKGKEDKCKCSALAEVIALDPAEANKTKTNKTKKSNKSKCKLQCSSKTSIDSKLKNKDDNSITVSEDHIHPISKDAKEELKCKSKCNKTAQGKIKENAPLPPVPHEVESNCSCSSLLRISSKTSYTQSEYSSQPAQLSKEKIKPIRKINCECPKDKKKSCKKVRIQKVPSKVSENEMEFTCSSSSQIDLKPSGCKLKEICSKSSKKKMEVTTCSTCSQTDFKQSKRKLGKTPSILSKSEKKMLQSSKKSIPTCKAKPKSAPSNKNSWFCKRKRSDGSISRCSCSSTESLTKKHDGKQKCYFDRMKNKIASKSSWKEKFDNVYKPTIVGASKSVCKVMRTCLSYNFCDVCKNDIDSRDSFVPFVPPEKKNCSKNCFNRGSIVNIYYNMHNVSFDQKQSDDDMSYTDEDYSPVCNLTEEEKRCYLLEKLCLLQDFQGLLDEESSSNYGTFE